MAMRRKFLDCVVGDHVAVVVKGDDKQHFLGVNYLTDHLTVAPLFSSFLRAGA